VGASFIALLEAPTDLFPQDSSLYSHYAFAAVPGISALLGYLLFHGNPVLKLVLLNVAIVTALVVNAAWSYITDPSPYANLRFFVILVGWFCLVATGWFAALYLGGKVVGYVRRAT
jgi:hypothetical protein